MANKVLAGRGRPRLQRLPERDGARRAWIGNPAARRASCSQPPPAERFAGRSGPLRVLVVGGSLGAKALNEIVPQALARMPPQQRPQVVHQSGAKQIDELRANYAAAGVEARAHALHRRHGAAPSPRADLVVCRAGASTVTEIARRRRAGDVRAVPARGGRPPDHQRATFLVDAGGGWLVPQRELTPERLADLSGHSTASACCRRATSGPRPGHGPQPTARWSRPHARQLASA